MTSSDPPVHPSQYPVGQDPHLEELLERATRIKENVESLRLSTARMDFVELETAIEKLLKDLLLHSRNAAKDKASSNDFWRRHPPSYVDEYMDLIGRLYFNLELVKDILKKGSLSEGLPFISRYLTEFSQVFDTYHSEWKKYIHGLQEDEINSEWKKYIYELRKEEVAMSCEKEGNELKRRRDAVEEELEQSSQGHEFSLIYKVFILTSGRTFKNA